MPTNTATRNGSLFTAPPHGNKNRKLSFGNNEKIRRINVTARARKGIKTVVESACRLA